MNIGISEASLIISFAVLVFAVIRDFTNSKRYSKLDTKEDTAKIVTMSNDITQIGKDIARLEGAIGQINTNYIDMIKQFTKMDGSLGTAWKQIDEIKEKLNK